MPDQAELKIYLWVFGSGLVLGLIFAFMAWNSARIARNEREKFKRMLADKMEIEASGTANLKAELEGLRKLNENLRIKVSELNQAPERRLQRDLEIFARAEKRMVERSPGFPAAWENVKKEAQSELELEEAGNSLPKRIFQKFTALTAGGKSVESGMD